MSVERALLPWRVETNPQNKVAYIRAANDDQLWNHAQPIYGDAFDAEFIVRAVNAHEDLLAALKECTVAVAAAMRVVADLDAMHLIGADSETRQQRFIEEMHVSGVKDGFGVRATAAIAKAEGRRQSET